MSIGFDSNLATAFTSRADEPAMQKMLKAHTKTFTPAQKARYAAVLSLPIKNLKALVAGRLKSAPQAVRTAAATAVTGLKLKEALAVLLIDAEYSDGHIVGTMPPKPLKVGKVDKLFGKSIKFGSPDGPVREGIVIGPAQTKKGQPAQINLLVTGEKAAIPVGLDQIIALGDATVASAWTKEAEANKFAAKEENNGAATIPAEAAK